MDATAAQKRRIIIAFIVIAACSVIYLTQNNKAKDIHKILEGEFAEIAPPPGTLLLEHISHYKPGNVLVQDKYTATRSFAVTSAYYSAELQRHGWYFRDQRTLKHVGNRYDIKMVIFCKGSLAASLSYSDSNPADPIYWLAMSWGLGYCD